MNGDGNTARDTQHWDDVWTDRDPTQVTWHQTEPNRSLALVERYCGPDEPVIDIGGGASVLVDRLLAAGWSDLSVLDISPRPLAVSRARLGSEADRVRWIVGDVREIDLVGEIGHQAAIWHDRAVFHFLLEPDDSRAYLESVRATLRPGGHVIIATFGPDGPDRCSGLPVRRWSAEALAAEFGPAFTLDHDELETHVSPTGVSQQFQIAVLHRSEADHP